MAASIAYENDVDQFLLCLDSFLQLAGTIFQCPDIEKERLLENAEQTLRDVVYLEPILPEGTSIVRTVSEVVVCMRE